MILKNKYEIHLKAHTLSISMEGKDITAVLLTTEHALHTINNTPIVEDITESNLVV